MTFGRRRTTIAVATRTIAVCDAMVLRCTMVRGGKKAKTIQVKVYSRSSMFNTFSKVHKKPEKP
jgi:hypothetical protein